MKKTLVVRHLVICPLTATVTKAVAEFEATDFDLSEGQFAGIIDQLIESREGKTVLVSDVYFKAMNNLDRLITSFADLESSVANSLEGLTIEQIDALNATLSTFSQAVRRKIQIEAGQRVLDQSSSWHHENDESC